MSKLKFLYNLLDTIFLGVWGLTIMDLVPLLNVEIFDSIDGVIKTLMAFVGLLYFIVTIPHKIKMQRLDRKIRKEELEKIERENK